MHHLLLILHLLAVTIWVGGHLILCFRFLPKALREQNFKIVQDFEEQYETIGIPALLILVISGVLLSYQYNVTISKWFSFSNSIEKVVSTKLILLLITFLLGFHARFFIIPKLCKENLYQLAVHIIVLTSIAVTMLIVGTFVRMGGF